MAVTRLLNVPAQIACITTCMFLAYHTPRPLRILYLIPQTAIYVYFMLHVPREESVPHDYAAAIVGAVWLCRGFAQFVALDPFRQHWWFKDPEEKRIPHTYPEMNFTERLQFNLSHATIARGIGWNWKIKNVPTGVPKGTSKASYLWWEAEHFMVAYLVQDIGRSHLWTVPWVQSDGKEGVPVKDLVGYRRVEMVLMLVLMTYIQMDLPYRLLSILGVYVGFWPDVADAVPTYGKLSECWSLRRFWGRVFHQTYRPVSQPIGQWIARDILRAKKGGLVSRYTQLYVAFIICAWTHVIGGYILNPDDSQYWTWKCFVWQAHGIVVEDFAIYLGKRLGIKESALTHAVGFVWLAGFAVWTWAWFFDDSVVGGWLRPETLPVSLIRGISKGQWAVPVV